jgi:hypothetical protein
MSLGIVSGIEWDNDGWDFLLDRTAYTSVADLHPLLDAFIALAHGQGFLDIDGFVSVRGRGVWCATVWASYSLQTLDQVSHATPI